MAYKQSPFPMHSGTSGHRSALRQTESDPYAEALKRDPNLPTYITERKKHEVGSPEYDAAQSKVNIAYGLTGTKSQVRHAKNIAAATTQTTADITPGSSVEPTETEVIPTDLVSTEPTPKYMSRKEIRQQKKALKAVPKGTERLTRAERKYKKLASKAESALAEGKTRKAKRLARRASRKLRKKGVRTSDEYVGKTSDKMLDIGLG